jgi:multicomponent Na+:H+ antiporter subunit E
MKAIVIFSAHILLSFWLCSYALDHIDFLPETAGGSILAFSIFFLSLWLLSYPFSKAYFRRIVNLIRLCLFFSREFIRSNVKLTKEILTPGLTLTPAVVKFPLRLKSDFGIMTLANISNLTPGTLILGISDDKKYLYVHTLYLEGGSVEAFKKGIQDGFEERLLQLTK